MGAVLLMAAVGCGFAADKANKPSDPTPGNPRPGEPLAVVMGQRKPVRVRVARGQVDSDSIAGWPTRDECVRRR